MPGGKSLRTEWVARFAIETGRSLFIATANPKWWYRRLKKIFPHAKLKRTEQGVGINQKSN